MTIILIILIIIFVVSAVCENVMYKPTKNTKEHEFEVLPKWGHDIRPFYDSVQRKPFEIEVPNGYKLQGDIIPAGAPALGEKEINEREIDDKKLQSIIRQKSSFPDGKRRVVILVHGRTANRYTMLSHGEAYYRLGFDLVVFDQRAHGESGGDRCSMGYHEAQDLVYLAGEVRKMFPEDSVIGLHGESMGAATVMLAAPSLPWLSFVAEDCGYATLRQEIDDSLKFKAKLPAIPFGWLAAVISDIREDFKLDDVKPIEAVKKTQCPMMFIHGGLDQFVPTGNVYALHDAKADKKMMHVFPDVPHAKSALMHNDEYRETLRAFLTEFELM